MSLRQMIENPPAFSGLPVWRKVLMVCALAFFVFVGFASVDKRLTIYGAAPDHPVPATGQVFEVYAIGHIRYVTLDEKESPLVDGRAGSWAGAAFMAIFFLWITSPHLRQTYQSRQIAGRPTGNGDFLMDYTFMKPSFSRWLIISSGLGLLAPIVWFLAQKFFGDNATYPLERVIRVVWPSSFWLLATDGIVGTPRAYLFILMAVVTNVILYGVLGSAVWSVKYFVGAKR